MAAPPRPNIIHIFADDLGKASVGVYGQSDREQAGLPSIRTPNLDDMAAAGMRFERAYAATLCSPSRGMLYTGFNQAHNANDRNTVNPRSYDVTLGDVLKGANYSTSVFGKWGFGGNSGTQTSGAKENDLRINPSVTAVGAVPTAHGYDEFTGYINHSRAHRFFPSSLWTTEATGNPTTAGLSQEMLGNVGPANTNLHATYTHDVIAERSEQFVADHYQDAEPFFMQVNYTIPHNDLEAIQFVPGWFDAYDDVDTSSWSNKEKFYAAMITRMDASIGSLIQKLEDPNGDGDSADSILDNTMIVFTSDNGATNADFSVAGLNHFGILDNPWRGGKRDLWEGGINMPQFLRWDGVVSPGTSTNHLTDLTDFMATAAELAGTEAPVAIDGHSLVPLITGQGIQRERDYLVFEHHEGDGPDPNGLNPRWAILRGDYKLIKFSNGERRLYNLATDPDENNQLNQSLTVNAELVAELTSIALGEGVELPASYDHEYATWAGHSGDSLVDATSWNATGTAAGNAPGDNWSATVDNGSAAESTISVPGSVTFLGLEVRGSSARQTIRVAANAALLGRNAVRMQAGARIHLDGGELQSNRWIDVARQAEISGQGTIQGDLYSHGTIAPGLASDLTPASPAPTPPSGVVTIVDFDFSGIQDGVSNSFSGSTTGLPLTQTRTLQEGVVLTSGFQYGPGLSPRHANKPGSTDAGNEFNIQGSDGQSSLAGAIADQNYMTYTIAPAPGLEVDIEEIRMQVWRNGNGAADDYAILASTSGFTASDALAQLDFGGEGIGISNQQLFVAGEPGELFSADPVEVRLYAWNNGGTNGNFHVNHVSMTGSFRTSSNAGVPLSPTGSLQLSGDFFHAEGGILKIDLAGTDHTDLVDPAYDVLSIDGEASIQGELVVALAETEAGAQFTPQLGDRFTFLTASEGIMGEFSAVQLPPLPAGLAMEVFYDTNAVTLEVVTALVTGDFNGDGVVNLGDYTVWRDSLGTSGPNLPADADGDGIVGPNDYQLWKEQFQLQPASARASSQQVPVPASGVLAAIALTVCSSSLRAR